MAQAGADINTKCRLVFQNFVVKEHGASSNLTEAEKKFGRTSTVKKLITGPMGESSKVANICDASVFPRLQNKAKKISDEDFVCKLLDALAIEKKKDAEQRKVKGAADMKPDEIVEGWKKKLVATLDVEETKTKNAAVVNRLTDVKGYTGSHKERFDESGKGKGKEGRETTVKNTGYVGDYKGEGTYGTKK